MIVLDCCAAVAILRNTIEGRHLKALCSKNEDVITSEFYLVEIRNTFWKFVRAGSLSEEEALKKLKKELAL